MDNDCLTPSFGRIKARITSRLCKELSTPLCSAVLKRQPRFHIKHGVSSLFGETTIHGTNPVVFIHEWRCRAMKDLIETIAHELVHCHQIETETWFNSESGLFDELNCEQQAYSLEPLCSAALAAALCSASLRNQKGEQPNVNQ